MILILTSIKRLILTHLLVLISIANALAQFSTTTTTSFLNNNGSGGVTFNFRNYNNFPIIITEIEGVGGVAGSQPVEFHVNNTPVSGAPASISSAAGWTQVASGTVTMVANTATTVTQPFFTGLSYVVPANTTIGMYVYANGQRYFTHPGGTTVDSTNGVGIICGTNISYGGGAPPTVGTNHPRGWIGTIKWIPAIPCSGTPHAGNAITNNAFVCASQNFLLSLANDSIRQNLKYQWLSAPSNTGPWTVMTNDTLRNITKSQSATTWYRCILDCNSNVDTSSPVLVTTPTTPFNGTYTVNPALPVSGTNFHTLRDLVTAMNCTGVAGPVTVDIAPGITLNGNIAFGNITGTSATNTITINGHGANITSQTTPIVSFSGTRFVTWDSLNVIGGSAFNGFGIHIGTISERITISNSRIEVNTTATATTNAGIVVSGSQTAATTAGNNGRYITLHNNTIIGGYYGISITGTASYLNAFGNVITNNTLSDFYLYGIYLANTDTTVISGNDISRNTRSTISTFYGIYGTTTRNTKVFQNKIHDAGVGSYVAYPIWFATSVNSTGFETEIINNAIWNIPTTTTLYALYFSGTTTGFRILHNTIDLNTTSNTGTVRGAWFAVAPNSVVFRNNIIRIYGTGSGTKHVIYVTTTSTLFTSNNNVLNMAATAGTNRVGFWTADRITLADWRTASSNDLLSQDVNPTFFDAAIGLLTPLNSLIDSLGAPLGVVTDITGAIRSGTHPDAGAYEFVGVNSDISVFNPLITRNNGCASTADTLKVTIKNAIGSSIDFAVNPLNINWKITGPINDSGVYSLTSGVLPSGVDSVIVLSSSVNRSIVGTYQAKVFVPVSVINNLNINDTANLITRPSYSGIINVGTTTIPTLQAAFDSLMFSGVCGPVTVNIPANSGPYVGNVVIEQIPGASATNNITINGNGNVLQSATSPIVRFVGAKYVTIDSLHIVAATGANVFGIHLGGQSEFISIRKCVIDVGIATTSTLAAGIVISGSPTSATTAGNNARFVTIENNEIIGGYYGINFFGEATYLNNFGHIIRNNTLRGFYLYGLYGSNSDSTVIENNIINRIGRATITTFYGYYGVNTRNVKFRNNRIHDAGVGSYTAYPIWFSTSVNNLGSESEIINNVVYNINSTSTVYGIYLSGTIDRFKIYHNTIDIDGGGTGTKRAAWFSVAPNNVDLRNNILSVRGNGTGAKHCIYVTTTSTTFTSNRNVLFMGATGGTINNVGYWTAERITLGDWQTASSQDVNSVSANPVYTNLLAGDFTPMSVNCDNIGNNVGVTVDITGALRSTTTPDPGAIEFTGIPGDIAATAVSLNRVSPCYGTNDTVKVTIKNLIGATADFAVDPLTVVYEVTGPINTTDSFTLVSGTLAPNTEMTLINNNINMSVPGNYFVRATVRPNPINLTSLNDTISAQRVTEVRPILSAIPKTGTAVSPSDTFILEARSPLFPAGEVKFTEICHWRLATGAAPVGGWPSYMLADDYVELMGVPNSDLAGYTMEEWTGTTLQHTVTFPAGTVFSPNGTMIIATGQLGSSVPSPTNFYYHSGNTVTHSSTGDIRGYIIKNPTGAIVDAVAFGAYSFPVSSGVTSSDWTGATSNVSSAGIRLIGSDLNNATNWVVESASGRQDPNIPNVGVPSPTAGTTAGFNWYYMGNPIDTNAKIVVGPYTVPGIYEYVAVFTNSCGFFTDTVRITATSTVPVTFASFEVMARSNDAELVWTTASELNNDRFEIERSLDGNTFEKIGTVRGKGTTSNTSSYLYNDANALVNYRSYQTIYYRLKQVDFDGSSDYSKTVRLVMPNSTPAVIELFPNPNSGQFNININANTDAQLAITVINSLGRKVHEALVHVVQGTNRFPINLNLPAGIYMATLQVNGETITRSFIVK
jgi:parallel beta-helix repeat protein